MIETSNSDEWEEFESGYQGAVEQWLAECGDSPLAEQTRQEADRHRSHWLRGYRDVLGQAYLTLAPAESSGLLRTVSWRYDPLRRG